MLRHYFQIAWRNLMKRKFYSLINITGLAIGMACCILIGLYLGSSVSGIVVLLSKDFIKLVVIAVVIAVPLCIWAMNEWLNDFSYRISIGPLVFLEAGLITVSIAMITIAWQSVKAARVNPVQSLRNE